MNDRVVEALGILQEECAEVIVQISKIRRFGLHSADYNTDMQHTHRTMLETEIGDVLALVDILKEESIISEEGITVAIQNKKDKLKKWSKLYE